MSDHSNRVEKTAPTRSKKPLFLALVGVALIIVVVIVVLILAGGNKTTDGTSRDQQSTVSPLATTNDKATGVGDPVN